MDYLSQMLYALTSAYSQKDYDNRQSAIPPKTNIGKLFSIFAWGLSVVREQADLIRKWDNLDYAQGSVLDRYGANFGVYRGGYSDALYRLFIKSKVAAQFSGGDENTFIRIAAELLGVNYTDLYLENVYPAKKRLSVEKDLLPEERIKFINQICRFIKRMMAAGVGLKFQFIIRVKSDYPNAYIGTGVRLQTCQHIRTDVAVPSTISAPKLYAGLGVRIQTCQRVRANIAIPTVMNAPALYAGLGVRIQTYQRVRAILSDCTDNATWGELLARGVTWEELRSKGE